MDHPILFSGPMVHALLNGSKTQTRRVLKPQPTFIENSGRWKWKLPPRSVKKMAKGHDHVFTASREFWEYAPRGTFYEVGDRLWVREAWRIGSQFDHMPPRDMRGHPLIAYPASQEQPRGMGKTRASIHMPRWASRLTLTVTDVRVQRLQDINGPDAKAEGLIKNPHASDLAKDMGCDWTYGNETRVGSPVSAYAALWDSINGKPRKDGTDISWSANPWVIAYSFTVGKANG